MLTQERTAPAAGQLVKHAKIHAGQRVLNVACGTGVVAVTAARLDAHVTGLDLTPELLERAQENAEIAGVTVTWMEGDVEELPFASESFDASRSPARRHARFQYVGVGNVHWTFDALARVVFARDRRNEEGPGALPPRPLMIDSVPRYVYPERSAAGA